MRYKQCSCGIMVTASHNPPSDNAVKAYWSTGGQLLPPHDRGVIDRVMAVTEIRRLPFAEGIALGADRVLPGGSRPGLHRRRSSRRAGPGRGTCKIIYSPLHGVGASAVCPALAAAGFERRRSLRPARRAGSAISPTCPTTSSNPENVRWSSTRSSSAAKQTGAELILATDPDCDRVGCAAPMSTAAGAAWGTLTGNQIGALLADYLLEAGSRAGTLTPEHYVVKTLVTTELIRRIADAYGVRTVGDLLVGFKYIGGVDGRARARRSFVLGAEESYGFLVGAHARDKDAAVASMLLAELTARAKAEGLSLHEKLDALFRRYGCHAGARRFR